MKILQVCPRYPPHTGGVETHVKEISGRLVERGHEVVVHTADAGDDVEKEEVRNGVEVHRNRAFSPGGAFHIAPGIVSAVRRADTDVVHAHNYHSLPLFFAALGVTNERFVVTTHYHGESASGFRDRLLSLYQPFGTWAVEKADEVIAVSEWEQEQLRDDFGVEAAVIPNGVEVDRFADAEPEERERPYLLTVGRLEEYKGVQHVIRAMSEMQGFDLLVAGSGPYRRELEEVSHEESVADRVEFLGYVDDERLPGLYAGAEVYVTLSEVEAYGITVAEALAAGTPCAVLCQGALKEWTKFDGVSATDKPTPKAVTTACRNASSIVVSPDEQPLSWARAVDRLEHEYNV